MIFFSNTLGMIRMDEPLENVLNSGFGPFVDSTSFRDGGFALPDGQSPPYVGPFGRPDITNVDVTNNNPDEPHDTIPGPSNSPVTFTTQANETDEKDNTMVYILGGLAALIGVAVLLPRN